MKRNECFFCTLYSNKDLEEMQEAYGSKEKRSIYLEKVSQSEDDLFIHFKYHKPPQKVNNKTLNKKRALEKAQKLPTRSQEILYSIWKIPGLTAKEIGYLHYTSNLVASEKAAFRDLKKLADENFVYKINNKNLKTLKNNSPTFYYLNKESVPFLEDKIKRSLQRKEWVESIEDFEKYHSLFESRNNNVLIKFMQVFQHKDTSHSRSSFNLQLNIKDPIRGNVKLKELGIYEVQWENIKMPIFYCYDSGVFPVDEYFNKIDDYQILRRNPDLKQIAPWVPPLYTPPIFIVARNADRIIQLKEKKSDLLIFIADEISFSSSRLTSPIWNTLKEKKRISLEEALITSSQNYAKNISNKQV